MGMTMAEKALARASGKNVVKAGEFVTGQVDRAMGHDLSFSAGYAFLTNAGWKKVWDPEKIVVILDHAVPASKISYADFHNYARATVEAQKIKHFYDCGVGICHQVFAEKGYAIPGQLIVGGDSHTTTYGAFGAAACGIGVTDLAHVLAKGMLWFRVPETIKFILKGDLPLGVSAKDIILSIAGQYTTEVAQYKSIEFSGPAAGALSMGSRMTICNMGVEIGAKFTFFETDDKAMSFLRERTDQPIESFGPDTDAEYEETYTIDVSSLEPQVACPHEVGNVKPISQIEEIHVQQAFLGSCTNARLEDLEKAAAILQGKKVHPKTRFIVIPASHEVFSEAMKSGVIQTLLDAGAMLGPPNCGPCGGEHMGLLGAGENAISSSNRNFKGRMGSEHAFIYLGSPETVAASAIEGKIADPRKYLRKKVK